MIDDPYSENHTVDQATLLRNLRKIYLNLRRIKEKKESKQILGTLNKKLKNLNNE